MTTYFEYKPNQLGALAIASTTPVWLANSKDLFILTFSYQNTLSSQIKFFGKNIKENHLEVSVGSGALFKRVLKWRNKNNLPATKSMELQESSQILGDQNIKNSKYDDSFNSVNMANTIHCLPDIDQTLKQVYALMKKDGTLAFNVLLNPKGFWPLKKISQVLNSWGIKKGYLVSPLEVKTIQSLIQKSGFFLIEEKYSGNTYNVVLKK